MPNIIASGLMCLGPSFFVSAAFILSIFANARCHFYYLDPSNPVRDQWPSSWGPEPVRIGLWCYQDKYENNWDLQYHTFDAKYETARALGTSVQAIGFFVWMFYLFASCKPFPPVAFKFVGLLGVVNCLLQSLVFLLNKSGACNQMEGGGGCVLSTGAKCAIAAAVLWFVGGVLSCAAGKEVDAEGDEVGDEGEGGGE